MTDDSGKQLAGHESQVDGLVEEQDAGDADTTRDTARDTTAAPGRAVPDTAAEGVEPAQEVPGGPQVDVPMGPGNVPDQR